jgi:hypothetical protein
MTLWLKYELIILSFGGARPHLVSDAQAEHTRKELMRTLSMRISSLLACSVHAPVPDAYAQHGMKALLKFEAVRVLYCTIPPGIIRLSCRYSTNQGSGSGSTCFGPSNPDSLVRGMDPRIRIHTNPENWCLPYISTGTY